MQTAQRLRQPDLIDGLASEPHRYQWSQAMRLLLRWLRQRGISPEQAYAGVLRFGSSLSLAFPASEILSLRIEADDESDLPRRIHLVPAFIGLLGGCGTLPLHDTQRIAALPPGEDADAAQAFLDMFANRMVALFCQAWGKYRLESALDLQGSDAQLPLLLALSGADRMARGAERHTAAYYAEHLRTRPVSALNMARVLAEHFGVPVQIGQFAGSWDYLPAERRSTLGRTRPTLGYGAVLGVRQWRRDRQAALTIGPLDKSALERFLPRGACAAAMARMLAMLGAPNLRYEVCLILSAPCIQPIVLGPPAMRRRLGWDCFLPDRNGRVAQPEVRYLLQI
ncbi:type VI secretion system baseplate subunit TssG [Pseudoduganella sp. UC29_71]|uniref:type VI secretion system baseplate subunit TssG n=1 Tax=Pseudoduganella sp. UC29_71 TaxID=3350174 RepID=UPI00366F2296